MLLANAIVDSSQPVSILAAASPAANLVGPTDSIDNMLQLVQYESVSSVLRQCDTQRADDVPLRTIQSSSALVPSAHRNDRRSYKPKIYNCMTHDRISYPKNVSPCRRCGNYEHWYGDHNADGSLPKDAINYPSPINGDKSMNSNAASNADTKPYNVDRVLKFSNATKKMQTNRNNGL